MRVLFVGVYVSAEIVRGAEWTVIANPFTGRLRRLACHILTSRISSRVIEAQVAYRPNRELLDPDQFPDSSRRFCLTLDMLIVLFDPSPERSCQARVSKQEGGRALHRII